VVFVSGYAENALLHDGQADAGLLFRSKPFRKRDLAKIVRQALDAPNPTDAKPKESRAGSLCLQI
jgi:FixJ family two-component response regulator